MAQVEPLKTLRYEPRVVGSLDAVTAPPYDVIDEAHARRSSRPRAPSTSSRSTFRSRTATTPTRHARARSSRPGASRACWCGSASPSIWVLTQDYTGPDGQARTRTRLLRARARGGLRPGPHPPARAHPPGPKEDRLRLTRATRANLSPIFSLFHDPERRGLEGARARHAARSRSAPPRTPTARQHALARQRPERDRDGPGRRSPDARAADRRRPPPLRDRARLRRGDRRRGRAPLRADVPLLAGGPGADDLPHPPAADRT